MSKIKKILDEIEEAAIFINSIAPTYLKLLFQTRNFFWERSRNSDRRFKEASYLLAFNSAALAFINYFVVKSIHKIDDKTDFMIGAPSFDAMHLFVVAIIFALCAKLASRDTPFLVHVSNAICSTSALVATSLVTTPLAKSIAVASLQNSHVAASFYSWVVLAGYCWMARIFYVSLRENSQAPKASSGVSVALGLSAVFIYMQYVITPAQNMLVHAFTS